jgi:surface antigen Omp85-like protein
VILLGRIAAFALVLALASGRAAAAPEKAAAGSPNAGAGWLDPRNWPFIPIPEIGTDPNSGTTFGLLPILLDMNENQEISRIYAPDVIYNPDLGYGGHVRVFGYPSTDTAWYGVIGAKQRIERELDISYETGITRRQPWSFSGRVVYDRSATERFFGFGNGSDVSSDSNYTRGEEYLQGRIGWNVTPTLQVAYDARPRVFHVGRGTFRSLPSIETRFPGVPGLGTENEWLNRLFVSYDTRDSADIPTRGTQIVGFAGIADRQFLSSVSYSLFGIEARRFEPLGDRFVLAGRVGARYMPVGDDAPFWALSSLGGDRSIPSERQPLRGFGDGRFVDRNLFSASVELRTRLFDLDLFSTDLSVEAAPFVDAGRVFHDPGDNPIRSLHVAGGVGLRAIAKPFIVGYVDIGYGSDGVAVFSGINYPF